jgi:predicted lysophospholipase L1 biosynthesis ABC-type transport system permease subunit
MGELLQAGVVAGLSTAVVLVLRAITVLVIVVWSLRTNEAGRKHALALLRVLGANRSVTGRLRGG